MQGLHKAIRKLKGRSTEEISLSIKTGSVLDEPLHSSRQQQLQNHCKAIATLEEKHTNSHHDWLEEDVKRAQVLENEWTYQDFERTILNALPALLPSSKTSLR